VTWTPPRSRRRYVCATPLLAQSVARGSHNIAYGLLSIYQLRQVSLRGVDYRDYFLAGKSVAGIESVEPAGAIVRRFGEAARAA